MTEEKTQLIIGALLHDVGKVIYRQGDGRRHSISGYDFLKEDAHLDNPSVLESVLYHHGAELRNASVADYSFAYITYIADNIASFADRRKNDSEDRGFEMTAPLEPVFNVLNGNDKKLYYHQGMLGDNQGVNYPTEEKEVFDEHFYLTVKRNLLTNLKGMVWNNEYVNSLLEILEANLSYVPSSTAKSELADISLFDHLKLTAAIDSCIYDYLEEKQTHDYKTVLFQNANDFYKEKAFLMFSVDISGIQDFIYTIHSTGALKNLRARSFYLEILMEHTIDVLLERLELSRANLIYSGGGHCYILLANTKHTKATIESFESELNQWLMEQFDTSLYAAVGLAECSANDLRNEPVGSYADLFKQISNMISKKKSKRYTVEQIIWLNQKKINDYTRECRVCKRLGALNEKNECKMCAAIAEMSKDILYTDFFSVISNEEARGVVLPFGACLLADTEESLKKRMKEENDTFVRVYSKNKMYSGKHIATQLWVGNYTTGETFEELAKCSEGIPRIGILRADVDNLGKAFVSGFENEKNVDKYVTLSRTAALSRHLSLFFKYYINFIISHPVYLLEGQKERNKRKASIVYSGGDDLFIVGAWDDILGLSIDIRQAFKRYTEGTLTMSVGIGVYLPGFPIHVSAYEVADLEEDSKMLPGKDAITFLNDGEVHEEYNAAKERNVKVSDATYSWEIFVNEVLGEKYQTIYQYFKYSEEHGKNFLYNLLELIRKQDDKINLARYVYLLARMEPDEKAKEEEKERYKIFSKKMYEWIHQEEDCRQLKTAITLYSYMLREKEEK